MTEIFPYANNGVLNKPSPAFPVIYNGRGGVRKTYYIYKNKIYIYLDNTPILLQANIENKIGEAYNNPFDKSHKNEFDIYSIKSFNSNKVIAVSKNGSYYKATYLMSDIVKFNFRTYFILPNDWAFSKEDFISTQKATKKVGQFKGTYLYEIKGYSTKNIVAFNMDFSSYSGFTVAVEQHNAALVFVVDDSKYMPN